MKKIFLFFCLLILPLNFVFAFSDSEQNTIFKAEVLEILEERETKQEDGASFKQQNLKLKGSEGEYRDQEIVFEGIGEYEVIKSNIYKTGDKVLVVESMDHEGHAHYYITDYVRTTAIWWLVALFVFVLVLIGKWKGLRSVISLAFSFLIIVKWIIPQILAGANPIFVTIVGSLIILAIIIYITEGLGAKSHLAVFSIFVSLIITVFLSWFFVVFAKVSGLAGEDVFSLINIGGQAINFQGLLLAGIIIGALGVLDDVVISQVATVEQIHEVDKKQNSNEIFSKAYKVGVSHISSMTNTLFLAYVGTSMTLLILFISGESAFSSWGQIINNEQIATEIVRTLAGSIGLVLSVPIATYVASLWYGKYKR